MKATFAMTVSIAALALSFLGCSAAQGKYPSRTIDFLVPAAPGGAWDLTARAVQKVLTDSKLVSQDISIVNKPGGNGEVAWRDLQTKDGYSISMNSSLLITNNLLGTSQLTYKDFTPLATVNADWETLAVPQDSNFKSADALMKKLKDDPASVKIGIFGIGTVPHLAFIQAAQAYGVDIAKLNFLVYKSGAEIIPALLGHHIDATTMYVSEAADQFKAGKLALLAVDSEARLSGLDSVPTWKELGKDVVLPSWRGIMGPAKMTKDQIAYWDDKLGKMVATDAWKKIITDNNWQAYYKNSADSVAMIDEQTAALGDLIRKAGLVKK
ncbi:MAG TPA: tripartite tricarboxylate transporter substrate binding protein [Rectinemataceae bacterium]|nr:tripartite tricarboxylate transporter substrate binding protein [Rectinemataceae bacterium]